MDIQLINDNLLSVLHWKARENARLRQNFDLRTTPEDSSQRMLNALEPGTKVPIHRHLKTSETVICLEGCLDWVFYEELPNLDAGGPIHDGEVAMDESCFKEVARVRICPREKSYGVQVPPMTWHSVQVYEPSTIFEAKDGKYERKSSI
ncbi:MAG: WbuC family cupin fold metalloprotein [Prevotella sp.]|nr:WbuC family cupin fold metalloprotein [Prevotella sp.]